MEADGVGAGTLDNFMLTMKQKCMSLAMSDVSNASAACCAYPAADESHEGGGPPELALLDLAGKRGLGNLVIQLLEGPLDGLMQLLAFGSRLAADVEDGRLPAQGTFRMICNVLQSLDEAQWLQYSEVE